MMRSIFLLFLLLSFSSCKWITGAGTPFFEWSGFKVPEGTPVFQRGWKDGCGTSSYSRGNIWYRTFNKHKYDTKLIGNPEYRFGYSRGYTWCFQQILAGTSGPVGSFDKYLFPHGYDSTYNAADIGGAWDSFFLGNTMGASVTNPATGLDATLDIFQKGVSGGTAGAGGSAWSNPLWAGGSSGQFFGQ